MACDARHRRATRVLAESHWETVSMGHYQRSLVLWTEHDNFGALPVLGVLGEDDTPALGRGSAQTAKLLAASMLSPRPFCAQAS